MARLIGRYPMLKGLLLSLLATTAAAGEVLAPPGNNAGTSIVSDPLADGFRDPPTSARPHVWWHWMNGNITKDGITKDLEWMKRIGIGGLQNFDANLATPQVVDQRLVFMTPPWKDAFRHAATVADRLGLEMAIAGSPGWSETGGPWVAPKDGLKKLVWSETLLAGGKRYRGTLKAPPGVTGPYQGLPMGADVMGKPVALASGHYADIMVLGYPVDRPALPIPKVVSEVGTMIDGTAMFDDDLLSAVAVTPATGQPGTINLIYATTQTIRSASVYMPGSQGGLLSTGLTVKLESSSDGTTWQPVALLKAIDAMTTVSFAPVTARRFRLVLPLGKSFKIGHLALSAEARVDHAETKAGFSIVPDYYALASTADRADTGIAARQVVNLTDRMRADGTLDWMPPKGNWRILRMGYSLTGKTNHPAPPEATGLEVDKFDARAVRSYLETYLDMYGDAAGREMIGKRGVQALLTDSTEIGATNWTPDMIAQFKRLRGYDPTPWLPALTGVLIGDRAQSDAFLFDFRRTLADLMASEHYGTVAKVAQERGLIVYGEALEDNRPVIGDDMAMRSYADIPMAAIWSVPRKQLLKPTYVADMKGAASVAHIYGRDIVAAESLTSLAPAWSESPADLRRTIDLAFATGINRPVIHTSVHQPLEKAPGLSLYFIGQFFNRHETWAEMAKPWVDYMARSSFLLQQGRSVADVAYFYGEEAPLTGLFGPKGIPDAPTRYGYDFVNADILTNLLSVDKGDIVAKSGAHYRLLYLGGSSQRMTLPVLRRLASLVQDGATVVGDAPIGSPGLIDDPQAYRATVASLWSGRPVTTFGKGRVVAGRDIEAALASIGAGADFSYTKASPDSQILFAHRQLDDGDAYFVTNRQNRIEKTEARFRVTGKVPEIWRADTGAVLPVSYRIEGTETVVPLDMGSEDSFFVLFRKPSLLSSVSIAVPTFSPVLTLDGPWDVTFQQDRGAPASVRLTSLGSLSEQNAPGIKYFSGVATYQKRFKLPKGVKPGAPMQIDLGAFGDVAEVRVNGKLVGTLWHSPHKLDIGTAIKSGANQLDIRVANLWVNRLVGDVQPDAMKVAFTTVKTYRANSPLRPSGLIGPVVLETVSPSGP